MKNRLPFVVLFLILFLGGSTFLQAQPASGSSMWRDVSEPQAAASLSAAQRSSARREIVPTAFRTLSLDRPAMEAFLKTAPTEAQKPLAQGLEIQLPLPEGGFGRFNVAESPIMAPGLAARYPEIKTYVIQGIDDPTATGRIDLTYRGLRAAVFSQKGRFFIDPYWSNNDSLVMSYYTRDFSDAEKRRQLTCGVTGSSVDFTSPQARSAVAQRPTGASLRTYRLALAADYEYSVAVAGSSPTRQRVLAAMVTSINRVTAVYEREFAIRLMLVSNTDRLIFTTASSSPYTNNDSNALLDQNQTQCDNIIGNAGYDIGHVFTTGGGGLAGLGVVCETGQKAQGETGSPKPVGDAYDIDYVAHEIGHQFGANHTFNGTDNAVGAGNRNASTAYEPGSGSTIMAYAGICEPEDLQQHSDDYFHSASYSEIDAYTSSSPGNGAGSTNFTPATATGNSVPVIAGLPTTATNIPAQTPFALTASATDGNGDTLTYCWEEYDKGVAQDPKTDNGTSPIFRSYAPTTSPTRYFPSLKYILNNANIPPTNYNTGGELCVTGELLPTKTRTMTFRVSVRDNRVNGGGQNYASMQVTSNATSGPFKVSAPNAPTSLSAGVPFSVSWAVANTTAAPVSCANVRISYSTDGGNSFPVVLLSSTANDGTESVTIPNSSTNATTAGRIKIEAVGNIFFDISDANFTVTSVSAAPTVASFTPTSGVQQTAVVITGTDFSTATAVRFNGLNASSYTIDSNTQITARVPANAGTGPISVVNSIGTGTSTSNFGFLAGPAAPTISGFSPTNGIAGTNVVISGTDFSNVTRVAFNGANAVYTVNSSTQISATVPTGATTGPLSVATTSGTATSAGSFNILSGDGVPVISSATTASGTIGGAIAPYQIAASNLPTSFAASHLPAGLSLNNSGTISGVPSVSGTILATISATNAYGTGSTTLAFSIAPASGAAFFSEDFASITSGDSTSTSGSSNAWAGNANFPTPVRAFQAGSAVRLGSGSNAGSLTSKTLDLRANGGAFSVKFDVKGWTVVEGDIRVTVTGSAAQVVTYSAVAAGSFETKTLNFTGGTASSTLKIETTAKRAYIDNVSISGASSSGPAVSLSGSASDLSAVFGSSGQPASVSVAGSNLTADVVVSAPGGFEISKSSSGVYSSSLTFTRTNTSLAASPFFVRIASGPNAGNVNGVLSATSATAIYDALLSGSIAQASQTIVFGALPEKKLDAAPFALNATGGGSGQALTYTSSNPNVAAISGNTVTLLHAGQTTITASQAGNSNYLAASPVSQALSVAEAAPTFASSFPGYGPNDSVGGVPALVAYALGGSVSENNLGILPQATLDADGLKITFLARIDDAHLAISAEGSVDLSAGWTAPVSQLDGVSQIAVPEGFQRQTWKLNAPGKGFLRVRVLHNP